MGCLSGQNCEAAIYREGRNKTLKRLWRELLFSSIQKKTKQMYLFVPNKCLNSMEGLIRGQQLTKSERLFSVAFPFTPNII